MKKKLAIIMKGKTVLSGYLNDIKEDYQKKNILVKGEIDVDKIKKLKGVNQIVVVPRYDSYMYGTNSYTNASNRAMSAIYKTCSERNLTLTGVSTYGSSAGDRYALVEFVEAPECRFFVATQAHPEFKSRPLAVHPLFMEFIKSL